MIRFVIKGGNGQVLNTRAVLFQQLLTKETLKKVAHIGEKGLVVLFMNFWDIYQKAFENNFNREKYIYSIV
jgi:hypothetical protein